MIRLSFSFLNQACSSFSPTRPPTTRFQNDQALEHGKHTPLFFSFSSLFHHLSFFVLGFERRQCRAIFSRSADRPCSLPRHPLFRGCPCPSRRPFHRRWDGAPFGEGRESPSLWAENIFSCPRFRERAVVLFPCRIAMPSMIQPRLLPPPSPF